MSTLAHDWTFVEEEGIGIVNARALMQMDRDLAGAGEFFTPQMIEADPPCSNAVIILPWIPFGGRFTRHEDHAAPLFRMEGQTILPYEMPVTKIIEDNSVKDLFDIDDVFVQNCCCSTGDAMSDVIQHCADQIQESVDADFIKWVEEKAKEIKK